MSCPALLEIYRTQPKVQVEEMGSQPQASCLCLAGRIYDASAVPAANAYRSFDPAA